ncbi:MAG: hypothetical protein E6J71_14695 [Deltaproteobacteria bacterium]|nr:MAG: hypothetical protein E6J71_14695 [Deltaproteobacteria bacterium]
MRTVASMFLAVALAAASSPAAASWWWNTPEEACVYRGEGCDPTEMGQHLNRVLNDPDFRKQVEKDAARERRKAVPPKPPAWRSAWSDSGTNRLKQR